MILFAVFLVAGFAKLADRAGAREALLAFGVPPRVVAPLAIALPVAEMVVAVALLVPASVPAGAVAALGLLLCFCAAISLAMLRGERPQCHCFGQLHSAPAGAGALVRNTLLAGLAAAVLVVGSNDPGPSGVAWLGTLTGGELLVLAGGVALAAALLGVTLFAAELLRRHGVVVARLEALEEHTGVRADSLPEREAGLA